ncbi:MAG: MipA/OmpV family protein [Pseudomonadota bacterium]
MKPSAHQFTKTSRRTDGQFIDGAAHLRHFLAYWCSSMLVRLIIFTLAMNASMAAVGQEQNRSQAFQPPGWIVGAGYVAAPDPFVGDAGNDTPFPLIGFIGERLTWLGPNVSYQLAGNETWSVTAAGGLNFLGFDADTNDPALAGLIERDNAIEAGLDLVYGPLSLDLRQDVSGTHDGFSARIGASQGWQISRRLSLEGSVFVDYLSEDLADYYYGVSPTEALSGRAAYGVNAATNVGVGAQFMYRINKRAFVISRIDFTRLDDTISDSPIASDTEQVSAFIGIAYELFADK